MINKIKKLSVNKFCRIISIISLCFLFLIFPFANIFKNNANALASRQFTSNETIFLRSPTYSTYYDKKVYTLDALDGLIKTYNTETNSFENEYISLNNYSIIDAIYLDNLLFALAFQDNEYYILKIDVISKSTEFKSLTSTKINQSHTKIFVQRASFDTEDYFVISLTNSITNSDTNPVVMLADQTTFELKYECEITFDTASLNVKTVKDNLYKIFALKSSINALNLIFIHDNSISFTNIALSTIKSGIANITSITPLFLALENTINSVEISSVNLLTISNISYFAITYYNSESPGADQKVHIYEYNIGDGSNTRCEKKYDRLDTSSNPYTLTNGNYIIYSNKQSVHYKMITRNNDDFLISGSLVSNPELEVTYFTSSSFKIKTAKTSTKLLKNPWDEQEIVNIPKDANLVEIGYGTIKSTNTKITDYSFCMFTANDKNYTGYVNLSDIESKPEIDIEDYDHNKDFTVSAETKLYSLPTTTLVGADGTSSFAIGSTYSSVIRKIDANLKVTIVDTISGYTANGIKLVKVKVNDDIGYIDCSSIIDPPAQVKFLVTNAIIKADKTKVYADASTDSAVNDVLNKDKAVKIEGKRNLKNGFTFIVYNDEYGNVLNGYIKTDYVETTSWTTLQIVGCVLIAINIGLLILILYFKKRNIGKDGQKYVDGKKANYKETTSTRIINEDQQ